ncbi:MAG TPA: crosslink repair DNA glycosylase YcaQ family protein, partial [Candidatus Dormibacteraeota bacterium]|nr:crosslink repair DNA glycosylase YcaQ family protein [Candidatus Dormibacteraeota bacterium]
LLKLGDLSESEIVARSETPEVADTISELVNARRAVRVRVGGDVRYIAVEYASRYRDALGTPLPPGLAEVFLTKSEDPLREILRRYARTHGPFTTADVATRYGLPPTAVESALHALHGLGKLLEGEFRPGGTHREWCDPEVLQQIRRKSLARLRREIEPVEQKTFARLSARWQGVIVRRRGLDALLDTVENLQGAALLASELEREILPARIAEYRHGDLDTVMASGQVVWVGVEQVGDRDGRVALYLTESLPMLLPPQELRSEVLVDGAAAKLSEKAAQVLEFLAKSGASFFAGIHAALGGGFPGETRDALWELVWAGQITNDTFHPLRDLLRPRETKHERGANFGGGAPGSPEFLRRLRSRTGGGGSAQGRWSLVRPNFSATSSAAGDIAGKANDGGAVTAAASSPLTITQWSANIAQQLLVRHGIVLRETAIAENIPRGYPTIYPALKTMEDSGWVRRGMFVAGLGAAQFAMPSAVDMLRSLRSEPQTPEVLFLAATDPANPYGTLLPWPRKDFEDSSAGEAPVNLERSAVDSGAQKGPIGKKSAEEVRAFVPSTTSALSLPAMSRTRGAGVILINGELAAFFRRMNPAVRVFLPESEPELTHCARELAKKFAEVAIRRQGRKTGLLIGSINEMVAREHFLARFLEEAGFVNTALGFQMRRVTPIAMAEAKDAADAAAAEEAASDNDLDDVDPKITGTA